MSIVLSDVNDVAPKFLRHSVTVRVDEGLPIGHIVTTLVVEDPDTSNKFDYKVITFTIRMKPMALAGISG